jgi:hypothetical protein
LARPYHYRLLITERANYRLDNASPFLFIVLAWAGPHRSRAAKILRYASPEARMMRASVIGVKYATPISTHGEVGANAAPGRHCRSRCALILPPCARLPCGPLVRAVLATGLNGLNPSVRPTDYALQTGPYDRDVPLLLRVAVCPTSLADSPLRHLSHGPIRRLWSISAAYWRAHPRRDPIGHFSQPEDPPPYPKSRGTPQGGPTPSRGPKLNHTQRCNI